MLYGITVKEDAGSFAPCLHSGFCKLLLEKCFLLFEVTSPLRCEPSAQRFPRRDKKRGRLRALFSGTSSQQQAKKEPQNYHQGSLHPAKHWPQATLRPRALGEQKNILLPSPYWKGIFKGNLLPLERSFVSFSVVQKRKGRGFRGRPERPKE